MAADDEGDLAERLARIERRLALYDMIASYGPAVDSGAADWAAGLWGPHGTYDYGDHVLTGPDQIADMVRGRQHQGLIGQGAAHILGFPRVRIDGDRAVVTGYSQVCRHRDGRFELWRVSANRWELRWDGDHWLVESRAAYPLDGREAARVLLSQGLDGRPDGGPARDALL